MQRAIKVYNDETLKELEKALADGWEVFDMCPMPSSSSVASDVFYSYQYSPTCLVIIEKK